DRDTILLGKGTADGNFEVKVSGESAGKPVNLTWDVKATKPNDENAYLAQWVDYAKADGGYTLPTLGSEGLWEARRVSNFKAQAMAKMGQQAAASGNTQQARQFVNEATRLDPNNANALVLKSSLDKGSVRTVSTQAGGDAPPPMD